MPTKVKLMEVVAVFRDLVKNDTDIETFCQTNFGKSITIFTGLQRQFPSDEDSPFVAFLPDMKSGGCEAESFSWSFSCVIGLLNDNYSDLGNGAIEWEGLYLIDNLSELISESFKNLPSDYNISADIVNFDMIDNDEMYPLATCDLSVAINMQNVLGVENIPLRG